MPPNPPTTQPIFASWGANVGIITAFLDDEAEEVEDIDDAWAAEWLGVSGAYEGRTLYLCLDDLTIETCH